VPTDSAGDYDLRAGAVSGATPALAARSDTVRTLIRGAFLPVIAPGQALAMRFDGQVVRPLGSTALPIASTARTPSYVVRSNPEIIDPVTGEDTALPKTLPARVRDLARRITRNAPTNEAKVAAIERYLHTHEVYRLDSPVAGLHKDAVDDFLFVSHEGFCEHFASAEAVMLRSLGIPARLVVGFVNGEDRGTRRIFRGTDAHAWVQFNVGGQRWVFSDPTAGATIAPNHQSWLQRVVRALRAHWRLGLGSGAVLLVVALFARWWVRAVRVRRVRRQELASSAGDQALAAFARLETSLERVGLGRSRESSIQELMRSLSADWPGGLPDPARKRAALVVVERVLYDAAPVPDADVHAAVTTLDALAELTRTVDLTPTL
jgi:transglutaminase-like putative cysteine protease